MKLKINTIKAYLASNSFSPSNAYYTIKGLLRMDKESRGWFIRWYNGGPLPDVEIEGITLDKLINKHQMKPTNAFITFDWLKHDPDAALYCLARKHMDIDPSEQMGEEAKDFFTRRNQPIPDEDTEPLPDVLTDEE